MAVQIDILDRPIQVEIRSAIPVTISGQFGTVGPRGLQGDPGVDAPQQVFYQPTEPPYTGTPFIWFETNGVDDVVNLWVNDGNV